MNNSKQESKNELKVISKMEVNTKPKGYDETVARNPAQLGYVHKALDNLIVELNTKFVPESDDVLHNNSNSISQLNDMLTEERSKLDELITKVGNENSGLDKVCKLFRLCTSLNNLQTKVEK